MAPDVFPFQNYYQIKPELPGPNDKLTDEQIESIMHYTGPPIFIPKYGIRIIEPSTAEDFQLCFLQSGKLEITMLNDYGSELFCWTVEAPYLVVTLHGEYCSFSQKALLPCILYPCSNNVFLDNKLAKDLYRSTLFGFSRRLQIILMNMFSLKNDNTPCRIYKYIYQLAYNQKTDKEISSKKNIEVALPSQERIAKITNTHRSSVIKCIHQLCDLGIIEKKEKKKILITDMDELLHLINIEQEASSNNE